VRDEPAAQAHPPPGDQRHGALEAGLGFPRAAAQAPWRRSARGVAAEAGFVDEAPHVGSVLEPPVSGPGRDLVWVAEALGEPGGHAAAPLTRTGWTGPRGGAWRMGPSPKTRTRSASFFF